MPYELVAAIQHAQRVNDWNENLVSEEMPPQWMWPFEDELEIWFEQVEEERKNKYGGPSNDEPSDMTSNELARGRGR